jgi:threonine synthase
VLATAHPAKFPEVVAKALPGVAVDDPILAAHLAEPGSAAPLAPSLDALRRALRTLVD